MMLICVGDRLTVYQRTAHREHSHVVATDHGNHSQGHIFDACLWGDR
jgi:hypothetical protein